MSTDTKVSRAANRPALLSVAKQIDELTKGALTQFDDAGDFASELAVATTVQDMRLLLTDEVMAPVMALMNTDIGFRTDRDPKQTNKQTGQPNIPYAVNIVRDAFIESRLRGFHLVGNEFNIIAGRFYACKNGFERKVKELTKGTCEISIDVPQMQPGSARVKCRATWSM